MIHIKTKFWEKLREGKSVPWTPFKDIQLQRMKRLLWGITYMVLSTR